MPHKNTKLMEENLEIYLYDLGGGRDYLKRTQKAMTIKESNNDWPKSSFYLCGCQ
jgi:hypothetical protein